MSRTALFISIIALVLAVLGYFLLRKRSAESPDRVGKYSAGQYMGIIMMGLILCMAALCICVLLARQVSNADVVTDLLSMQGITLTITGTAMAMVTIVTAIFIVSAGSRRLAAAPEGTRPLDTAFTLDTTWYR